MDINTIEQLQLLIKEAISNLMAVDSVLTHIVYVNSAQVSLPPISLETEEDNALESIEEG